MNTVKALFEKDFIKLDQAGRLKSPQGKFPCEVWRIGDNFYNCFAGINLQDIDFNWSIAGDIQDFCDTHHKEKYPDLRCVDFYILGMNATLELPA